MVKTAPQEIIFRNQELLVSTKKLTLVLMAGLPGSGKTTVAEALGRELGWGIVDKDRYRKIFLERGLSRKSAADLAYNQSFHDLYAVLIREQTSVIFDSAALHTFILKNVKDIIRDAPHVSIKIILCIVGYKLRHERLANKSMKDITVKADPFTEYEYLQCFQHLPSDPSERLILHTDTSLEICIDQAKDFLREKDY